MSTLTLILFLAGCSGAPEPASPEPEAAAPAPAPAPAVDPARQVPVVGGDTVWTLPEEPADPKIQPQKQLGLPAVGDHPGLALRMIKRFVELDANGERLHNGLQSIEVQARPRSEDGTWGPWVTLEGPVARDGIRTRNAKRVLQAARLPDGRVFLVANLLGQPPRAWTFDGSAYAEATLPTDLGSAVTADAQLIAHDGGLLLAWSDYRKEPPGRHLTVARYAEGSWSRVGGDLVAETDGVRDLALSVEGGVLALSWAEMAPDGTAGATHRQVLTDGRWVAAD